MLGLFDDQRLIFHDATIHVFNIKFEPKMVKMTGLQIINLEMRHE